MWAILIFTVFSISRAAQCVPAGSKPSDFDVTSDQMVVDLDTESVCKCSNCYFVHDSETDMTAGAGPETHRYVVLDQDKPHGFQPGCQDITKLGLADGAEIPSE